MARLFIGIDASGIYLATRAFRTFFINEITQRGLHPQPIVDVGTQAQCCHSRRKTCGRKIHGRKIHGRKIHGRKMKRRKTSIRVLYFSAPHFSARPDFSNQTPDKLRGTTRNQLLVIQKAQRGPSGRNQISLCHVLCLFVHLFAVFVDTSPLNPPDFGRTMGAERSEAFVCAVYCPALIVLPSFLRDEFDDALPDIFL